VTFAEQLPSSIPGGIGYKDHFDIGSLENMVDSRDNFRPPCRLREGVGGFQHDRCRRYYLARNPSGQFNSLGMKRIVLIDQCNPKRRIGKVVRHCCLLLLWRAVQIVVVLLREVAGRVREIGRKLCEIRKLTCSFDGRLGAQLQLQTDRQRNSFGRE
jgi:hypothetical protein